MIPAKQTIKAYKGDTFSQSFTLKRAGFDFSGWTCRIEIRDLERATVLHLSTPSLNIISMGEASLEWTIDYATMNTFIPGVYLYDVQLTSTIHRDTYIGGQFKVLADVTDYD